MEVTPALDPRAAVPGATRIVRRTIDPRPGHGAAAELETEPDAEQMSLARRLRQPRTIISIADPRRHHRRLLRHQRQAARAACPSLILAANPWLVLAAFARLLPRLPAARAALVDAAARDRHRVRSKDSTEIIFLSWLVNCVVPAKLGDVYRAYLLKINSTASLSPDLRDGLHRARPRPVRHRPARARGGLLELPRRACRRRSRSSSASASWSSPCSPSALFTMRNFGRRIIVALPFLPHQVLELYDRFEEGVFGALIVRQLPILGFLTGADLDDRGAAPVLRRPGARLRRRVARHVGRGLRRSHRLAADGRAAQPGRAGHRRGRRRRRPDRGLRRAAARGDRDRAARSRHQRVLGHRLRVDRVPAVVQATRHGTDPGPVDTATRRPRTAVGHGA